MTKALVGILPWRGSTPRLSRCCKEVKVSLKEKQISNSVPGIRGDTNPMLNIFHRPAFPCSLGDQSSGAKKDETFLMSVGSQHLQYLQKPTFLTYYGLGIYHEWTAAPTMTSSPQWGWSGYNTRYYIHCVLCCAWHVVSPCLLRLMVFLMTIEMASMPLKCFGHFDVGIEMNWNRSKKSISIKTNETQNASKMIIEMAGAPWK
jgi:hypothetical protein